MNDAIAMNESMLPEGPLWDRAIDWSQLFTRAVIRSPELRDALPDNFHLILVPKTDPEVAAHNRDLAARNGFDETNAVVCEIELLEAQRVNLYPHIPQPAPLLGIAL